MAAVLMVLATGTAGAQELYCNVQVSAQKIQGSNREIFQSMQRDIYVVYEQHGLDRQCLQLCRAD